jgi:hypothetical protein
MGGYHVYLVHYLHVAYALYFFSSFSIVREYRKKELTRIPLPYIVRYMICPLTVTHPFTLDHGPWTMGPLVHHGGREFD